MRRAAAEEREDRHDQGGDEEQPEEPADADATGDRGDDEHQDENPKHVVDPLSDRGASSFSRVIPERRR